MNKVFYIKLFVFAALLAVLGIVGYNSWNQYQQKKFINYLDPKFTAEEIKALDGKISDLGQQLDKAKKANDKDEAYRFEVTLGIQYEVRGKLLEAKNTLLDAIKLKPDNAVAWNELGVVETRRTDYVSAEKNIRKAIELNPTSTQYHRSLIDLMQGSLKYSDSSIKSAYQDALAKTNNNIDIITIYARYLEQQKDIVGAIEQWKKAEAQNPQMKDVYEQEIAQLRAKVK